jgi:hypothetical protein
MTHKTSLAITLAMVATLAISFTAFVGGLDPKRDYQTINGLSIVVINLAMIFVVSVFIIIIKSYVNRRNSKNS